MVAIAILVVIAVAAGSLWLVKRRRRKAEAPGQPAAARFGAVEIQARQGACEAANRLRGRRYLAKEAPALPLPDCTSPQCSCAFVKLSDRRTDDRRIEHSGLGASLFLANNRRNRIGRRDSD